MTSITPNAGAAEPHHPAVNATVLDAATPFGLCDAAATATAHRFALFDHDAYRRELEPLLRLAVANRDGGLLSSWVHANVDRLKHPERCTFLEAADWDVEFEEFDVSEYARFALTAYCEPETFRRLGERIPDMMPWLQAAGADEVEAAAFLLGEPVEQDGQRLRLSTGAWVGLLNPVQTRAALVTALRAQALARQPGASQRLLPVRAANEAAGNGHSHNHGAADPTNGHGSNGHAAGQSQRRVSPKAVRRALEQWTEVLEEAADVGVGVLYLYEMAASPNP